MLHAAAPGTGINLGARPSRPGTGRGSETSKIAADNQMLVCLPWQIVVADLDLTFSVEANSNFLIALHSWLYVVAGRIELSDIGPICPLRGTHQSP